MNDSLIQPNLSSSARLAVSVVFFVNGTVLASWVPHVATVQAGLGLTPGTLGLALLGMAAGAVISMPLAGALIGRVGSRAVTTFAALAFCLTLPLPLLASSAPLLGLALLLFGAANGAMDVSMNAQAVDVERRHGRPIMSAFHGLFSLGGLAGASLAVLLVGMGVAPLAHVLGVAAVCLIVAAVASRGLLAAAGRVSAGPRFARPTGSLVGLGALAFCIAVGEGSMADWSAVYLRGSLGTDATFAAAGYAAFSLTMAAGRFVGDRLVARFGPVTIVRASASLAAVGLAAGLIVGHPVAAIVGFGCVGAGLANLIPLLFSAAGRAPGVGPGVGIAAVATVGYFGFLAGPPLIGFAAELVTLPVALGVVVLFCAVVAAFARLAEPAGSRT